MREEVSGDVRIEPWPAAELDRLRPLWLALHRHHQDLAPELGPYVDDDASWQGRRRMYVQALANPDTFVLVALVDGELLGYAVVVVDPTPLGWKDTWVSGSRTAELLTLLVSADARGQGVGARLLEAVEAHLDSLGIGDVAVYVLPHNTAAVDLYRRRGFHPTWLVMRRSAAPAGGARSTKD